MTHICVSKLTIIGSDNGLSPSRRQAIIWTNARILLIRPLGTNFNGMLIEIIAFSFMKMRLKVSSAEWRPFCLGLNVLILSWVNIMRYRMQPATRGLRIRTLNLQKLPHISVTLEWDIDVVFLWLLWGVLPCDIESAFYNDLVLSVKAELYQSTRWSAGATFTHTSQF